MKYLTIVLLCLTVQAGWSQTESEWRGIGRTGIYNETGLLKNWPADGPEKIWSAGDIGTGYSSPSFGAEYIYVTGRKDSMDYLTALDFTGKQVWQVSFGHAWNDSYEDTRTTPTLNDGKVYMISGMGEVACHDGKTGEKIWYRNAYREFSGQCNLYGVETFRDSHFCLGLHFFN